MTDLPEHHDGDEQPTTPPAGGAAVPPASTPPAGGPDVPPSPPHRPTPPSPAPQQWPQHGSGTTADQRNWAVGAHLSAIAASMIGLAVLGPLVVYLVKKDEDRFVGEHSREALNFQLTWLIGGFVATILAFILTVVTVGLGLIVFIPAGLGFLVAWFVFMIKGAMAASRGEYYRYPLTVRMIS